MNVFSEARKRGRGHLRPGATLPWRRGRRFQQPIVGYDDAELLEEAEAIGFERSADDFSIAKAKDADSLGRNRLLAGRDAAKVSAVRPGPVPANRDLVRGAEDLVDGVVNIRERGSQTFDEVKTFSAARALGTGVVGSEVRRNELLEQVELSPVETVLEQRANDCLVFVCRGVVHGRAPGSGGFRDLAGTCREGGKHGHEP